LIAAFLLFSQIALAAQTNEELEVRSHLEYFVPEPLEPELSSDGKSLYNASPPIVYIANPEPPRTVRRISAPANLLTTPTSASATFIITYVPSGQTDEWGEPCSTFPDNAKTVFNAAANIWSNIIQSSVPITIRACWASLSGGTLGYAGGGPLHRDFSGAPRANTWYVGALANALGGSDLDPAKFDMHITYNSNFTWYYGTDGNTPSGQYDLLSVVLHEIAHGLGFSGSMSYSGGQGSWGYSTGYPNVYDVFMRDGSGIELINTLVYPNPSTALGTALTSNNLWFHGANAMAANGGQRVKMYAPSTWASGSSYSHLDYATFNDTINELMVYAISAGESIHDPGPVTKGLFKDIGWQVSVSCTYSISPTSMSFSAGGGTGSVSVTTQSGCAWTAAESLDWATITSGSSGAGSGTVNYSVSANSSSSSRIGNMTIAGKTFVITQAGTVIGNNILLNPGFESGSVIWAEYSSAGYQIILQDSYNAHTGSWFAWMGGSNNLTEYIYQDVTIPSDTTGAYVQFWYRIATEETTAITPYDILYVQIRRPSDNTVLATISTLSNLNKTTGWVQSPQYDISSFKGQTIRLMFYSTTDSFYPTSFMIDDVNLTVSVSQGGIFVGDFNGDGMSDILTREPSTGGAVIRQSKISGTNWNGWQNYWAAWPSNHSEIYVGDYNGDGRKDILTRDPATGNAVMRLSVVSGGNWAGWSNVWAAWPASFSKVYVGDYNGDGKDDILTVNPATGAGVLRQSAGAAGAWTGWTNYWAPLPTSHTEIYVGNFNGDGRKDILTRDPATGNAVMRLSLVSGGNWAGWSNVWAAWPASFSKVYVGDYNGDGKDDILTVNPATGAGVLRQSAGAAGTWTGWTNYWAPLPSSHTEIYVGNFNGDGRKDILTRDPATGNAVMRQSLVTGGNWSGWQNYWAAWPMSYSMVYVGDYNGGGVSDILTANPSGGAVMRQSIVSGGNWAGWQNYWAGW
jgi:hypothetical protein